MCVYKQIIDVSILDPRQWYTSLTKVPLQQKKSTTISLAERAGRNSKSASTVTYLLHSLKYLMKHFMAKKDIWSLQLGLNLPSS